MPPTSSHRWLLPVGENCQVIVMHFATLPAVMENYFPRGQNIVVPLTKADVTRVQRIYAEVLPHYKKPRLESVLWFERALLDLCVIVLGKGLREVAPSGFDSGTAKAQQALQWHRAHLAEHITVNDVCNAIHVSPCQLRRIFKATMHETPKQAFARVALDEACRLMAETQSSIKEIAYACGYAGFNQFYRSFKQRFKMSPNHWRKNSFYGKFGIKSKQ